MLERMTLSTVIRIFTGQVALRSSCGVSTSKCPLFGHTPMLATSGITGIISIARASHVSCHAGPGHGITPDICPLSCHAYRLTCMNNRDFSHDHPTQRLLEPFYMTERWANWVFLKRKR